MSKGKKIIQTFGVIVLLIFSVSVNAQDKQNSDWVAPKEADQLVNPFKGDEAAIKAGKKLYKQQCSICHGDRGKGDGVAGLTLNPKPTNFTSDKVKKETDGALFWKMTNGNPPMASYKDILTEEQRWQLVNYIRTLAK